MEIVSFDNRKLLICLVPHSKHILFGNVVNVKFRFTML